MVVREVLARLVGLEVSFVDFVARLVGFSGSFDVARRRDWRDNTVVSVHVVVDRTASLMESVMELVGKTVTAILRELDTPSRCAIVDFGELDGYES